MRGTSGFCTVCSFADHLHPSLDDMFVQHAANVTMAGHAASPGTTRLRDAPNRLWIVLGD